MTSGVVSFILLTFCLCVYPLPQSKTFEPTCLRDGDKLSIIIEKMTQLGIFSKKNLPLDFIGSALINTGATRVSQSLDDLARGIPYTYFAHMEVTAGVNTNCHFASNWRELAMPADALKLIDEIEKETRIHIAINNILAISTFNATNPRFGFPIGRTPNKSDPLSEHNLFTHFKMRLLYTIRQSRASGSKCIELMNVFVHPTSIQAVDAAGDGELCELRRELITGVLTKSSKIRYSFGIEWVLSERKGATIYAPTNVLRRSLFPIIHYTICILGLVFIIRLYGQSNTFTWMPYSKILNEEDPADEVGWKFVRGDVFRSPAKINLLIVLVSCGLHIGLTVFILFAYRAIIGYSSVKIYNDLVHVFVCSTVSGFFSGYISGLLYKRFSSSSKPFRIAFFVSSIGHISLFVALALHVFACFPNPMQTGASIFFKMAFYSIFPLLSSAVGFNSGYKKASFSLPMDTNLIPRHIPPQPIYLNFLNASLISGLLPLNSLIISYVGFEESVWNGALSEHPLFRLADIVGLALACSFMAMIISFSLLQHEDYRWWWKSFICQFCGVAIYCSLLSICYAMFRVQFLTNVHLAYYISHSIVCIFTISLTSGSFGFLAALWFVRKIYSTIKVN